MFCRKCGKNIPDKAGFCPYCGTKVSMVAENLEEEDLNRTMKVRKAPVRQTEGEDFSKPIEKIKPQKKKLPAKKKNDFTKKSKSRGQTKYLAIGLACVITVLTATATVVVMKTLSDDGETQASTAAYVKAEESQTYEQAQTQAQVNQQNLVNQQNVGNQQYSTSYQSVGTTSAYQQSVYQQSTYQSDVYQQSAVQSSSSSESTSYQKRTQDEVLKEWEKTGFIFPDSDKRVLMDSELREVIGTKRTEKSVKICRYAINEIAARHGAEFDETGPNNEFYSKFDWYENKRKKGFSIDEFNHNPKKYLEGTELANFQKITKYRNDHNLEL